MHPWATLRDVFEADKQYAKKQKKKQERNVGAEVEWRS